MSSVDRDLLLLNQRVQSDLWTAAKLYLDARDVRWMFAFAHFRITQQLNEALISMPYIFAIRTRCCDSIWRLQSLS